MYSGSDFEEKRWGKQLLKSVKRFLLQTVLSTFSTHPNDHLEFNSVVWDPNVKKSQVDLVFFLFRILGVFFLVQNGAQGQFCIDRANLIFWQLGWIEASCLWPCHAWAEFRFKGLSLSMWSPGCNIFTILPTFVWSESKLIISDPAVIMITIN